MHQLKYPANEYTSRKRAESGYFYRLHGNMRYLSPISAGVRIWHTGGLFVRVGIDAFNLFYTLVRGRLIPLLVSSLAHQQGGRSQKGYFLCSKQ